MDVYFISGHFYVTRRHFIQEGLLQGGKCGYVEIPNHFCGEIDNDDDLALVELRLAKHGFRTMYGNPETDLVLDAPTEFQ